MTDTVPATTAAKVAQRAQAPTGGEPAKVSRAEALKQMVVAYAPVIERALPSHMTTDRFSSTILTACRTNPDLMGCEPASVVAAALRAAQLGLEPNDERGYCYLIPRKGKATFQMGYKGLVELGRRSGLVRRTVARTVYTGDGFTFAYGTEGESLQHHPTDGKRGPALYWYAIAWAPDGGLMDFVVLNRDDVEYHRAFSAQPDGQMWVKSYDAAARKTAVRELYKLLPQSVEMAWALGGDDRSFVVGDEGPEPDDVGEISAVRDHPGAIDAGATDAGEPTPPSAS